MARALIRAGLDLIKRFEGFSSVAYQDSVGVWTIGYGTTHGITKDTKPITENEAEGLLLRDAGTACRAVERLCAAPLTDNQFAALVSFTYNLGSGALQRSTLRQKLNRKEYHAAADEFMRWTRAGGFILKGLVRRRSAERALFLT